MRAYMLSICISGCDIVLFIRGSFFSYFDEMNKRNTAEKEGQLGQVNYLARGTQRHGVS
jgi:hypothetical protein